MPWFRRRKTSGNTETAPAAAAALVAAPPEPVTTPPPVLEGAAATDSDPTKPKRRRGTRGGKGRKKTGTAAPAETKPETKPAAGKKPAERRKSERKPERATSQRAERRQQQPQGRRRQPQKRAPLPDAKRELLVSVDVGEQRVAVLEDDKVAEVYLERPERRSIAGNIYLGQVDNVLPGMEAAFVEIGLEKNGFLYVDEIVVPELEGKHHGRKIQDLISKGETILVQAVKDPMKTKGARLTTQISLPGRFVVFVPQGEGLGVSRRLDDDERQRLKDILKKLNVKEGGVIVRTAAEGASEEDIERDLVFLQRLWKTIQARADEMKPPALVYQEAELPLRVTRDLFTGDFEKAYVDNDRAYKRIVGYLKKTSPHMVERVERYKEKAPLMEHFGVDAEIKSTLNRRVDLPSGGYLIFDYAEAFTVIDVNTGRFVGGRGKNSNSRLEDTITKNNLEAVKEVVRQLRLRDIGGIIVIDFIDMANPKNRAQVEEALRTELERDRTKTYVVEISPLGLVEMTRQNVTDGPREVMTRKCPTCGGDGIVLSDQTAAVDVERRLRALAAGSRSQAFRVEVAAPVAQILIGSGASRLVELEAQTKKRFFLEATEGVHSDHLAVLEEGKLADLQPEAPVAEGAEVRLELVEIGRYDAQAGVGKVDGLNIVVGDAAGMVGKKVKARVERVLDGVGYAALVETAAQRKAALEPLTAESEAEKPTRKPPARRDAAVKVEELAEDAAEEVLEEPEEEVEVDEELEESEADVELEAEAVEAGGASKKRTRRGSRGGRRRKKPTAAEAAVGEAEIEPEAVEERPLPEVRIHVPDETLGRDDDEEEEEEATAAEGEEAPAADDGAPAAPKKRTRRGSRGGKGRKRKPATTAAETNGGEPAAEAEPLPEPEPEPEPEPVAENGDFSQPDYVPMSEWIDDFERRGR
ncbi:MAG: Rne/Rng family ribonuclease [Actinobacteria bacterium]|nr:MAG: Rne/Rng family ribonuclease [Actinomycetota bacterium]